MALEHYQAGRLDLADQVSGRLAQKHPNDPALGHLRAAIALRSNRPEDALAAVELSLSVRPDHVPSLLIAARAASAAGDRRRAIEFAARAAAGSPRDPEAAFLYGTLLLQAGDPGANAVLPRLESFPQFAQGWLELGQALWNAGHPQAALVSFGRAISVEPGMVEGHLGAVEALLALGRTDEAVAATRRAEALRPHDKEIPYRCGVAFRRAAQLDVAGDALERAVQLDPGFGAAWFGLGLVRQDQHDYARAIEAYRAALTIKPNYHEAAVNLGTVYQEIGDLPAAVAAYAAAMRVRPESFGLIAQALTCGPTGCLWLDLGALRRRLAA